MKLLCVEDSTAFVEELRAILLEISAGVELVLAASKQAAEALIRSDFFDLMILDLKIPSTDSGLDASPEHGHAIFYFARQNAMGLPIFVLTGSPAEDFTGNLVRESESHDIWGLGKRISTVYFLRKIELDQCATELAPIIRAVMALGDVELDRKTATLLTQEQRLLRIFGKLVGGAKCEISRLGGGLSSARVYRVLVTAQDGSTVHNAIAKIGPHSVIEDEAERYTRHVTRLGQAATPRHLRTLNYGAGNYSGVFYGLVEGFDGTGFGLVTADAGVASAVIENLRVLTDPWVRGVAFSSRTIGEIRRRLIDDAALQPVVRTYGLDWIEEFERRRVQCRWACIHGDLHGSNVLVNPDNVPILIDYGDVGEGPASLDPITFELSALFHPQRPRVDGWPSQVACDGWAHPEVFANDATREFVVAARAWATEVAAGEREVAASAYAFLVRQLKYNDTDKDLAIRLLESVRRQIEHGT